MTADQINAELGYEDVTTQGQGKKDAFRFTFSPDVEGPGAENGMTGYTFRAEDVKADADIPGSGAKGYVRFQALENGEASGKYLMVDTAYYDSEINAKYDLKMAVKPIEYPKYAVVHSGKPGDRVAPTVKDGDLYINGEKVDKKTFNYANVALAQLKRQSNFKAIFYPSTQSLRLQAEMIFKANKEELKKPIPWWLQIHEAVTEDEAMLIINKDDHSVYSPGDKGRYFQPFYKDDAPVLKWLSQLKECWRGEAISGDGTTSYESWIGGSQGASAPKFAASALNNVVKLTTLTNSPKHVVLTCDVSDAYDEANPDGYDGLLTHISLEGLMPIYTEVADIPAGFYYMQNANAMNTDLLKKGDYRYEDLAATAATYAYWNALGDTWSVGEANLEAGNTGENGGRTAAVGNVVYASDLKEIPSAQWYIDGNGGYYTITNRESKRPWGTSYWWKLSGSKDTYVNHNTYMNGTGLTGGLEKGAHRDTVRLIPVSDAVLRDIHSGYLNLSAEEAAADTSVFNFRFHTLGSDDLFLGEANGILKVMKEHPGRYKLERVMDQTKQMIDKFNGQVHFQDSLVYGLNPSGEPDYQLARAMYYIYKDNVSSGTTEGSGIRTREYITLDGGKYLLSKSKVEINANGYTTYNKAWNNGKADPRKSFYVKRISTSDPDQYVLVDPNTVGREKNANGTEDAQGVRVFVNQLTAEVQPGGLISQAASNVYDNSVFTLNKLQAYNYRDIRTAGNVRDTLTFFKESNPSILLYENGHVKGANVGLLDRINDAQAQKNYSLFVDTANLAKAEKPMFLLAVRPVDTDETSNIPGHNRHLYTTADYLVNMVDSAKAGNDAYKYTNVSDNIEKHYYRLGFVPAVHKGSSLFITNNKNEEIALGGDLTKASFAFRYTDANRDNFFIETIYDGTTPGWVKVLNEVPVVTKDIQEAEVYQVKKATTAPTANEGIAAEEGVSIEAIQGAVIVKNAAGKTVTINNVLGKSIASQVLSSDSETIAVPAGIVVVSVEGAEAVKTVVK